MQIKSERITNDRYSLNYYSKIGIYEGANNYDVINGRFKE
jgi:hypothetical protein